MTGSSSGRPPRSSRRSTSVGCSRACRSCPRCSSTSDRRSRSTRRSNAHATPSGYTGVRRLKDTVILDDLRCDGSGHARLPGAVSDLLEGGVAPSRERRRHERRRPTTTRFARAEADRRANVHGEDSTPDAPIFRCQATELLRASEPVGWWSMRSLVHELTGGNVGPWRFVRVMTRLVVEEIARRLHLLSKYPFRVAAHGSRRHAPAPAVGLQPGELVQIRTKPRSARRSRPKARTEGSGSTGRCSRTAARPRE